MSGILAVISEYNPFHNGHLKHLNISKQLTKADFSIAVISGNFVQRGDAAIVDKWSRAEMALQAGFDIVLELPTIYSVSSAENFAEGAVKMLNSLGIVDFLSFGSELGEITPLNDLANLLYKEPKELSSLINQLMKTGVSYPKAREAALMQFLGGHPKHKQALNNPNNILGIEYLKALKKYRSAIQPITIKREYSEHNSTTIKKGIASSTAIRTLIQKGKNVHTLVPFETYELLQQQKQEGKLLIGGLKTFEKEIIYTLRRMTLPEIASLPDVSDGLENRIKLAANNFNSLDDLIKTVKSKNFTQTRIQRILLYALLNISQKDMTQSRKTIPYIRILGFNKHGKKIVSAIARANPKTHVIISVKKFMENCNDSRLRNMLSKDILATNIYTLGYEKDPVANLDYTHKIVEK